MSFPGLGTSCRKRRGVSLVEATIGNSRLLLSKIVPFWTYAVRFAPKYDVLEPETILSAIVMSSPVIALIVASA